MTEALDLIEQELRRQLGFDPDPVSHPMRRLIEAGGKRLRPRLVLLAAKTGDGAGIEAAVQLAVAVELIHNATLVHDDYVDESPHRHGEPTVAASEGPERAIAVGDYYFAKATRLIAELGNPAVTVTVAAALEAVCRAQIDDLTWRGAYPGDRESYLRVVRGKTAALFAAACRAGAELAGAPPDVVERLRSYGELIGTAFQMADDLVDFSPHSGKPLGQDVRQRVLSLPLIYASEDERHGPELRQLLAGPLPEPDVQRVIRLVAETGATRRVQEEAANLIDAALAQLPDHDGNGVRTSLAELATATVNRRL